MVKWQAYHDGMVRRQQWTINGGVTDKVVDGMEMECTGSWRLGGPENEVEVVGAGMEENWKDLGMSRIWLDQMGRRLGG